MFYKNINIEYAAHNNRNQNKCMRLHSKDFKRKKYEERNDHRVTNNRMDTLKPQANQIRKQVIFVASNAKK